MVFISANHHFYRSNFVFRHKTHPVRFRKTSCCGFKSLCRSTQTQLEVSEVTTGFVAANITGNVPDFLSKYPCFVPRSRTGNCPRPPLKHRWWKWLEKGWNKVLSVLTGFFKHGEVPSLLYKYIMTFCTLVPLFIFFAPAPHISCVRPWKCHSSSTCTNVNVTAICRNRQHLLSRLGCDFMGCVDN